MGYNISRRILVKKTCSLCYEEFLGLSSHKEYGVCGNCILRKDRKMREVRLNKKDKWLIRY